ncbi:MAG: hypothetical protein P8R54_27855 [Myxococcota bacterium]|nr:hypothetical protein [Myxococcota bacterium]
MLLLLALACDTESTCPEVQVTCEPEVIIEDVTTTDDTTVGCPDLYCDCPESSGGSARAVLYIYQGPTGESCYNIDDPGLCCPDGFSYVGIQVPSSYSTGYFIQHAVCLED